MNAPAIALPVSHLARVVGGWWRLGYDTLAIAEKTAPSNMRPRDFEPRVYAALNEWRDYQRGAK